MSRFVRFGTLCGVLLLLAVSGCSQTVDLPITGLVTGTVKFNGQPVTTGMISLENRKDGIGATAVIADGKFAFDGAVSAGHYQVTVLPPKLEPSPTGAPQTPQQILDIPLRYRSSSTSDLVADIDEGENKLDFTLKP